MITLYLLQPRNKFSTSNPYPPPLPSALARSLPALSTPIAWSSGLPLQPLPAPGFEPGPHCKAHELKPCPSAFSLRHGAETKIVRILLLQTFLINCIIGCRPFSVHFFRQQTNHMKGWVKRVLGSSILHDAFNKAKIPKPCEGPIGH